MADEVGTLKIRVISETGEARKEVRALNEEMARLQVETLKADRAAARTNFLASGVTALGATAGAAATGFTAYRTVMGKGGKTWGENASKGIRSGLTGMGAMLGKTLGPAFSAISRSLKFLAVGGLIGAGAGLLGSVISSRGGGAGERKSRDEQALELMQQQLDEARRQGTTLQQIQSQALASRDPLGRSAAFFAARSQRMGTNVTLSQIRSTNVLTAAQQRRAEVDEAIARRSATRWAELSAAFTEFRTDIRAATRLRLGRYLESGFGMANPDTAPSYGQTLAAIFRGLVGAQYGGTATLSGEFVGADYEFSEERQRNYRERLLSNRMGRLMFRGPAQIAGPSPTLRAGSEAEYAFRVQQQAREDNRRFAKDWEDQVIEQFRKLIAVGMTTNEQLREFKESRGIFDMEGV